VKTFSVRIVANDGVVLEKEAVALRLRGVDGRFTTLADHAALVSRLAEGTVVLENPDGQCDEVAIVGGFLRIEKNKAVLTITR